MLSAVIRAFLPAVSEFAVRPIGSGLIHHTWKVELDDARAGGEGWPGAGGGAFILQEVNTAVFVRPEAIAENLDRIGRYLEEQEPAYLFAAPLRTAGGDVFFKDGGMLYRMFPFVAGSRTYDVVSRPEQAYEASRQFGLFTRKLRGFEVGQLRETLPQFHDLELRYAQFAAAVLHGDAERVRGSRELIGFLEGQRGLVDRYVALKGDVRFALRVTHHDTKISNVLFDAEDRGLCVIDLDTVMPGYYISDVGDMIRTYVSAASEEEEDLSKVVVRGEFYRAIYEGYMGEMAGLLSAVEQEYFGYAGWFMTYMQALRFLADHLNRDVYYGARYEGHNFNRAANQVTLLRRLIEFGG
jgi:hypothetical protein